MLLSAKCLHAERWLGSLRCDELRGLVDPSPCVLQTAVESITKGVVSSRYTIGSNKQRFTGCCLVGLSTKQVTHWLETHLQRPLPSPVVGTRGGHQLFVAGGAGAGGLARKGGEQRAAAASGLGPAAAPALPLFVTTPHVCNMNV